MYTYINSTKYFAQPWTTEWKELQVHTWEKLRPSAEACRTQQKNFNQNILTCLSQRTLTPFTLFDWCLVTTTEFNKGWWDSTLISNEIWRVRSEELPSVPGLLEWKLIAW